MNGQQWILRLARKLFSSALNAHSLYSQEYNMANYSLMISLNVKINAFDGAVNKGAVILYK